jgi:hypothetical protein
MALKVYIHEAVAHINRLLVDAQKNDQTPSLGKGFGVAVLHDVEKARQFCVTFPNYSLEYEGEFANRIKLNISAAVPCFNRPAEVTIGLGGSYRDPTTTKALAHDLSGVARVAAVIETYLRSVEVVPTEEAEVNRAAYEAKVAKASAERRAAALAEENARAAARLKKANARRRLNRLILKDKIGSPLAGKVSLLLNDNRVDEANAILRTIPG